MALTLTPVPNPGRSGRQRIEQWKPRSARGDRTLQALARQHTEEAVKTLVVAMRFKGPQQVPAAIAILDRGWGKPAQHVTTDGADSVHLHLLAALAVQPFEAPRQTDEQQQPRTPLTIDGSVPTE